MKRLWALWGYLAVEHPLRVLLWWTVILATGAYGLVGYYWFAGYMFGAFWYVLPIAAGLGGFLTLVAAIGFHLERH